EKVLYFAASIVTWVDEDARAADLDELRTQVDETVEQFATDKEERVLELRERLERRENYLQAAKETNFDDDDYLWAELLDIEVKKLNDDDREKLLKDLRKSLELEIDDTIAYTED